MEAEGERLAATKPHTGGVDMASFVCMTTRRTGVFASIRCDGNWSIEFWNMANKDFSQYENKFYSSNRNAGNRETATHNIQESVSREAATWKTIAERAAPFPWWMYKYGSMEEKEEHVTTTVKDHKHEIGVQDVHGKCIVY